MTDDPRFFEADPSLPEKAVPGLAEPDPDLLEEAVSSRADESDSGVSGEAVSSPSWELEPSLSEEAVPSVSEEAVPSRSREPDLSVSEEEASSPSWEVEPSLPEEAVPSRSWEPDPKVSEKSVPDVPEEAAPSRSRESDSSVSQEAPGGAVRPLPPSPDPFAPVPGPADPFGSTAASSSLGSPPTGQAPELREMTPWQPEPPPNRRAAWIGGAIIGVVVIAALAGVIWFRNLVGDPLGSARSVPAQAQMVVTLDGLQLIDFDRFQSLIDAFAEPAGEPGVVEQEANLLDALDEGFQDAMGVDFRNGVLPWVGRTATFAMWDVANADMVAGEVPELMLAVEVRDPGRARGFLVRVMDLAADEAGSVVQETTLNGETVLIVTPSEFDSPVSLYGGVVGDVMIFTASDSAFRDAVAARAGSSIVDSTRYTDALSRLPADRLVTTYVDGTVIDDFADVYSDLASSLGQPVPEIADPGVASVAASFALVDEGLQFDAVTVYRSAADVAQVSVAEPGIVSRLPMETLAYLAFPIDGASIDEAMATLEASAGAEFDQMAEELKAQTGIDIFGELLPAFDNGMVLAGYATREGMLGRQFGGFGLLGAVGVSDREVVADALAQLDEFITTELASDPSVSFEKVGDLRITGDGVDPVVTWGLGDDIVAVGSSITEVENMISGSSGGIHDAVLYQELDGALPGEGLLFYLDMAGLIDLIQPPPEVGRVLAPLLGAGASASIDGTIVSGRLVVAIDY